MTDDRGHFDLMHGAEHPAWDFLTGNAAEDHRNLRLIMETVESLYAEADARRQMRQAVERAVLVTDADEGLLFEEHDGKPVLSAIVDRKGGGRAEDARYSRTLVRRVWHTGASEFWTSLAPEVTDPSVTLTDIGMQSGMAVRLDYGHTPIGLLYVHAARARREYGEPELKVFRALAGLISAAIHTRRLADERTEQVQTLEQIKLARMVQERFTPGDVDVGPRLDVGAVARICLHLSGDYCDIIPRPDSKLALAIGDVSGKGIKSALYSAEARALTRRHMRDGDPPDVALDSLNRLLLEEMATQDFMTMFLAIVDPATGSLDFASAGHNPPFLRRTDGRIESLDHTGVGLGWWPDATYRMGQRRVLEPGDALLLYTDGMTESRNESDEMYQEERLRASLEAHAPDAASARAILKGILGDLDAFCGAVPATDDVTGIVLLARA